MTGPTRQDRRAKDATQTAMHRGTVAGVGDMVVAEEASKALLGSLIIDSHETDTIIERQIRTITHG